MTRFEILVKKLRKHLITSFVIGAVGMASASASSLDDPDCSGVDRWATRMAVVHLTNAAVMNKDLIDFAKTKIVRLASEKLADGTYRQIHQVIFVRKDGVEIEVITSNVASKEECSMSDVEVFVVSQRLGGK